MHCTAPTSSARGERGEAGGVPSLSWVTTPSGSLLRRIRHQSLRWCQDIPSGSPLPRYLAQVVEAREASSTNREDGIGDIQQRAPINASRPLSDIRQGLMFLTPRTRHQISVRLEVLTDDFCSGLQLQHTQANTKPAGRSIGLSCCPIRERSFFCGLTVKVALRSHASRSSRSPCCVLAACLQLNGC